MKHTDLKLVAMKAAELSARPSTMLPASAAKRSGPTTPICTSAYNQLVSQCQGHSSRAQVATRHHATYNAILIGFFFASVEALHVSAHLQALSQDYDHCTSSLPVEAGPPSRGRQLYKGQSQGTFVKLFQA
ncbi:MAG: hypothetical protein FRX49_00301 [Trebouxia sp. A1-2]|nr:MAG: hypothetical protein FRX49_00301 [Trebouxia sp. A1-2]